RLPLASHTKTKASVPTANEISAASTGEPPALASIALVGACNEMSPPAANTSSIGRRTAGLTRTPRYRLSVRRLVQPLRARREALASVLGDADRVLELRGEALVAGHRGPAVGE